MEKECVGVSGLFVCKRISLQDGPQLRGGSYECADRFAGVSEYAFFQLRLYIRRCHVAVKYHIPTGNIGLDPAEAKFRAQDLQIGHRQLPSPADIYSP